jgi:Flp pilus assembly pilin Flp
MAGKRNWHWLSRSRLVLDERGAIAIEFGLLALPFFAIIAAILETAVVFLASQVLESAVQDASRLIRTGQAQDAKLGLEGFRSEICGRTYGLFRDCTSNIFLDVQPIDLFWEANIEAPVDRNCTDDCEWTKDERYDAGTGTKRVLVQAYFRWPLILDPNWLGLSNLGDGTRLMGSAAVFRNEPF